MQINRDNLNKLLSLNDRQLKAMINKIAVQGGIDPAQFNIDPGSIQSIRQALGSATDEDIERIAEQYKNGKLGKRR
jgi:hypothetical protein